MNFRILLNNHDGPRFQLQDWPTDCYTADFREPVTTTNITTVSWYWNECLKDHLHSVSGYYQTWLVSLSPVSGLFPFQMAFFMAYHKWDKWGDPNHSLTRMILQVGVGENDGVDGVAVCICVHRETSRVIEFCFVQP